VFKLYYVLGPDSKFKENSMDIGIPVDKSAIMTKHLSAMVKEFMGETQKGYVVTHGKRAHNTEVDAICLTKEQAGLHFMAVFEEIEVEEGFLEECSFIHVLEVDQAQLIQLLFEVLTGQRLTLLPAGCGSTPVSFRRCTFQYMADTESAE
jgi:hypothetical protein